MEKSAAICVPGTGKSGLPRQGCLSNMHKISRDSPKPLIRDELISCILLQGHFLNCLLEGDLASKLLISCQNYKSMFSTAVSSSLIALSKITFFCVVISLWGYHAQLSQVQVNQVYRAWVDPLWNLTCRCGSSLCVMQLRLSIPTSALVRCPKPGPFMSLLLQLCNEGKARVALSSWIKFTSPCLCLHKSYFEGQLLDLEW